MTSIQHHIVTESHSTSNQLDNHLDALLDDLQTSVSRPGTSMALSTHNGPVVNGSAFGGQINLPPGATGYREITTTVTRENNGIPTTSRDYQIEYLNPANSVTVLDERSSSPALDLLKSGDLAGHQLKSYKTEVYDYKYSKTTTDRKTTGYGAPQIGGEEKKAITMEKMPYYPSDPPQQESTQFSRTENYKGETNVSKNLNELDMLLRELNSPPPGGIGDSKNVQNIEIERSAGGYNESSTMPKRSASATRETAYSERTETRTNRAQSPAVTPKSSGRTISVQREYNTMENRSHTSRRDSPSTPTLRRRTPSPSSGEFRPSNFSSYPINPKDLTPTRTVTSKSYSYSTAGRRTPTPTTFAEEPQPYRSPSPVSFPQKRSPSPVRKSLNRTDSGRSVSYQVSPPMSENPTVITYKYSSHSREQSRYPGGGYDERDQDEIITRPFPTSTPIPVGEQSPPKKLDELMASFQDSKSRAGQGYQGSNEFKHHIEYARESQEKHGGDLQRSPSFERNLRPSNVKATQSYSAQQQQNQEYQNQYQHKEQYQHREQYQQREQPSSYHREFQRQEEYQTRQEYPGQQGQQQQYQQQQRDYSQQREYQQQQRDYSQQREYQQQQRDYSQQREYQQQQYQQQREQYQQQQYQQYHQSQGGYQQEQREQFQQNRGQSQQSQQYQYQQHQQYQHQNSSQSPVNETMSSSQAHRATSATRSVAGPPVYYPPGVELFTKKEEAMLMQEQSSGKSKGKSKSKSEKSEKGKDKGKKLSAVPVCLPVCCAAPCSIM